MVTGRTPPWRRAPLALLGLLVVLGGCSGGGGDVVLVVLPTADGEPRRIRLERCDDGGTGGVVIDGVCL
ncbi:hypothetical protein BH23PSE1_BH23PSE1_17600 [soil metagenome]